MNIHVWDLMKFHDGISYQGLVAKSIRLGFSLKYLQLTHLLLMRTKTSPGEEASVREIFHMDCGGLPICHRSFRDHMLHALEGVAVARLKPTEVVPFNVDYPAAAVMDLRRTLTFPATDEVRELSFACLASRCRNVLIERKTQFV